jgi:hypothetical protein
MFGFPVRVAGGYGGFGGYGGYGGYGGVVVPVDGGLHHAVIGGPGGIGRVGGFGVMVRRRFGRSSDDDCCGDGGCRACHRGSSPAKTETFTPRAKTSIVEVKKDEPAMTITKFAEDFVDILVDEESAYLCKDDVAAMWEDLLAAIETEGYGFSQISSHERSIREMIARAVVGHKAKASRAQVPPASTQRFGGRSGRDDQVDEAEIAQLEQLLAATRDALRERKKCKEHKQSKGRGRRGRRGGRRQRQRQCG